MHIKGQGATNTNTNTNSNANTNANTDKYILSNNPLSEGHRIHIRRHGATSNQT